MPAAIAWPSAPTTVASLGVTPPRATIAWALFGSTKNASTASAAIATVIAGSGKRTPDRKAGVGMVPAGREDAVTVAGVPPATRTPVTAASTRRQGRGWSGSGPAGAVKPATRTTGSFGGQNGGIARGFSVRVPAPLPGICAENAAMLAGELGIGRAACCAATACCACWTWLRKLPEAVASAAMTCPRM